MIDASRMVKAAPVTEGGKMVIYEDLFYFCLMLIAVIELGLIRK